MKVTPTIYTTDTSTICTAIMSTNIDSISPHEILRHALQPIAAMGMSLAIAMARTADIKRCPMATTSIIWSPVIYTLPMVRIVMTMESSNSPNA